jgi:flagellar hook-associated protein 1 FlgK
MSLELSLYNARSGIKVTQQAMSTVSQNIANVNSENYNRRISNIDPQVVNGQTQGAYIASVTRNIDPYINEALRVQSTDLAKSQTMDTYYKNIMLLFGLPEAGNTLNDSINSFFGSVKALATMPESVPLRLNVIESAKLLISNVVTVADGLQKLRYQADQDISSAVTSINSLLTNLTTTNSVLQQYTLLKSSDTSSVLEAQDRDIKALSKYLELGIHNKEDGSSLINTANGTSLVDIGYNFQLQYTPISSIESLINNDYINPITVISIDNNGTQVGQTRTLITSGKSEQGGTAATVVNNLTSGKITALQQLRDRDIPHILDELDSLVDNIRNEVNAIHNSGSGYPALKTLTGTREVISTDLRDWQGACRIGIIDANGKPVKKIDGTVLNPLNLNFGALKSGTIAGQSTIQTIIDEINDYFYDDALLARTSLGNIQDIKMAATSDLSAAPSGQASFDFQLENYSQLDSTFQILAVSVNNGAPGLISPLPTPITISAGSRTRTNLPFTLDFGGAGGPYTVSVAMQVTDSNGIVSNSTIEYVINDNPGTTAIQNTKYVASAVSAGSAVITPPATVQGFAKAVLVDSNGNAVPAGTPGYLKLETFNSNYYISIDDLTSKESGLPGTSVPYRAAIPATNRGFSHYFELNNFFLRNPESAAGSNNAAVINSALNLAIRPDIVQNPKLLAAGQLSQSPQKTVSQSVGLKTAEATFDFNGIPSVGDTITVAGQTFTFVAAGVANDEIVIGASIPATLANAIAKLNASNVYTSGTVNNAIFGVNGNSLTIKYNAAGIAGNSYSISGSFSVIGASINSGTISNTPSGNLIGGLDQLVNTVITPWSYEMGISANQVATRLAALSSQTINFSSSGTLPAVSSTLAGYASFMVSYNSMAASNIQDFYVQQQSLYDVYSQKLQESGGVNLDQEMADTMQFQNAYNANARLISMTKELFETLLNATK